MERDMARPIALDRFHSAETTAGVDRREYAARRHHGRLGALRARAGGDRMRRIGVLLGVAERDLIPLGLADEVIE
jgi:hypothetical protein